MNIDAFPDKAGIRTYIRAQKALLAPLEKNRQEHEVWRAVEALPAFAQARHILLYHSLPDELSTRNLFVRWHSMGKLLYLPVVAGDNLVIRLYNPEQLQKGAYGIFEPQGDNIDPSTIELVIVPGVAFDALGNRLGRGKGYYDRLLSHMHAVKVGVCYACQLLPRVPAYPHDCRMDCVVTPAGVCR